VNLLGGHTDYSGGFVLPTTIDRAVRVALRRGKDEERVRPRSSDFDESATFALADVEENTAMDTLPTWARYVAGVATELRRRGYELEGFDAVIERDVPLGAGLSSSAALEVSTAVGLDGLFSLGLRPTQTAKLCQRAEQEHVGVECGIMDQFASRVGQAGHALFLDCRSLGYRHVSLPLAEEVCLVVADSGVRRELTSSNTTSGGASARRLRASSGSAPTMQKRSKRGTRSATSPRSSLPPRAEASFPKRYFAARVTW
jgi:galactokinase